MQKTVKTAISIPREDFKVIESMRKKSGKSRSEILVEAWRAWLGTQEKEDLDRQYEEAYRKKPENLAEIKSALAASAPVWGKEEW
ncbi:MAG: ribbon-helix-helix protein, CopG family [Planctomycetes bacterium]|nr:ribbon-helix-helix protein, CopG family [Planctomycetota bacterium]